MVNQPEKRLSIFLGGLYGGGAERVILNLIQGFIERDYEVDLVLARAIGPYLSQIPDKVRLVNLHASRAIFCLPALTRYIKNEKPTVIFSAINYANLITLWARYFAGTKTRIVISEHNNYTISSQNMAFLYKLLITFSLKRFYSRADKIIAVSQGVADDLANVTGIDRDRIDVIYNPIILPDLENKVAEQLEHPWFSPGEPPVIIAVGRLTEQKDFPTLINSFSKVLKNRPVRLMILGEGPSRKQLENLVKELGLEEHMRMPGFVNNPYSYMAKASIFALSSKWEGLPTVLVEALYCNVPVVSTDCPFGPREILRDGLFGTLVPVGDCESLAQAIQNALDGNTPKPTRESWMPFELNAVVSQYENILFD